MKFLARWGPWLLFAVGLVQLAFMLSQYWPGCFFWGDTSGTWTALAWDFAHGELYRPVLSSTGYGGTRYMPLYFVLQGGLLRLSGDPVASGVLLTLLSLGLYAASLYWLLLQTGLSPGRALPLVGCLAASRVFQALCVQSRADSLAAALVLLMLACFLRGRLALAGLCILGAFFTKFTCLYASLIVFWELWRAGKRSLAWGWLGAIGGLACLGCLVLEWVSHGRFSQNLQACSDGGVTLAYALGFPGRFWGQLDNDPYLLVGTLLGLVVASRAAHWTDRAFLVVLVGTMGIFVTPGISNNHFLELQALATLQLARGLQARPGPTSLLLIGVAVWLAFTPPEPRARQTCAAAQEVGRMCFVPGARVLTNNPLLAILNGRRPFLLDDFSLRILVQKGHPVGDDFRRRIREHDFSSIVLDVPRKMENTGQFWETYAASSYGRAPVAAILQQEYTLKAVIEPYVVLTPRSSPSSAGSAAPSPGPPP